MSYRADKRTDGRTQATTIPGGQNWPRVKKHEQNHINWKSIILMMPIRRHRRLCGLSLWQLVVLPATTKLALGWHHHQIYDFCNEKKCTVIESVHNESIKVTNNNGVDFGPNKTKASLVGVVWTASHDRLRFARDCLTPSIPGHPIRFVAIDTRFQGYPGYFREPHWHSGG